ncbi:MAG: hypothetical protein Q7J68_02205 [Thermoplasmata archaeon]|nr:hypothetical protein [Thermoplasmata archaeon]
MTKSELMFELSNKARVGIMRLASGRDIRHREIMLGSGFAPSEVTRHVRRLMDIGILAKKRDGSFGLTGFGTMALERLDAMEFLSTNDKYFGGHDLSAIPAGFDHLSMLRSCERIDGTMNVLDIILRINSDSHNFVNCILAEFNNALVLVQNEKLRSGVEINMLLKGGKRLPSEYMDNRAMAISVKAIGKIPFFFMSNEAEALLCFNGPGNSVDYSIAFRSSEPAFLEWCDILFNRYWLRGRDVSL